MLIRAHDQRLWLGGREPDQGCDPVLDRLGIRAPKPLLEPGAATRLMVRHPPLSAQLGLGEGVDVVRLRPDGEVDVERVVLAVLEALEAVDDERLGESPAGRWRARVSNAWRPSRAACPMTVVGAHRASRAIWR